jgi:hypothetical protein
MLRDSEIGNIAAIAPAGNPPASKYERLIADAKQVPAATTVVVYPREEAALRGPIQAAEAGIINRSSWGRQRRSLLSPANTVSPDSRAVAARITILRE